MAGQTASSDSAALDEFFRSFTAEWMRHNPDLATGARYFSGEEQDRLERQLTPVSLAWRRERIQLARRGVEKLRRFSAETLTPTQRLSADLLNWQLEIVIGEEPYLEYTLPLQQMNGANVQLVETLTVRHPLLTERDAENYVAALGLVPPRIEEAIQDASRLAARNIIPPRFILQATIRQMQDFTNPSPAQNPFVTALSEKLEGMKEISGARRNALRDQAANIWSARWTHTPKPQHKRRNLSPPAMGSWHAAEPILHQTKPLA